MHGRWLETPDNQSPHTRHHDARANAALKVVALDADLVAIGDYDPNPIPLEVVVRQHDRCALAQRDLYCGRCPGEFFPAAHRAGHHTWPGPLRSLAPSLASPSQLPLLQSRRGWLTF